MNNPLKLALLAGVLVLDLASPGSGDAQQPVRTPARRWNIISIMTDDYGAWAMGAYGNKDVVTPNMDRLASEGARFTNAFAASGVCSPSRVAFLTGLYPIQIGTLTDAPQLHGFNTEGLPRGVLTWPKVLQQNGYVTGLIGKWHLGRTREFYPTNYGFNYFFGFLRGGNRTMNPVFYKDGKPMVIPGVTADITMDAALRFIDDNKSKPFALLVHYREPHGPYGPVADVDMAPFKDRDIAVPELRVPAVDWMDASSKLNRDDPDATANLRSHVKERRRAYYASVHSVDRNLGRLVARLAELGLDQNTIIVFTSDQGYLVGQRGLTTKGTAFPLRNGTYPDNRRLSVVNLYDVSLKIPFLVKWPGVVKPGTVIDDLVSNIDMFASTLGMLGVSIPRSWPHQGRDFSPLLRGEKVQWRDAIFAQYDPTEVGNLELVRMIRTKRWKLVRSYLNPGGDQFFDLENDPEEMRNLFYPQNPAYSYGDVENDTGQVVRVPDPHTSTKAELQRRLTEWQRAIDDPALPADSVYHAKRRAARERWQKPARVAPVTPSNPQ